MGSKKKIGPNPTSVGASFGRVGLVGVGLALFFCGIVGCANVQYVRLGPDPGVRMEFRRMEIDLQGHAFFTAGSEADPDAILALDPAFVDQFKSTGWTRRGAEEIPGLMKGLLYHPSKGIGYGMLVKDENGVVKGKLYTVVSRQTLFVYPDEGVFALQTPNMGHWEPARFVFQPSSGGLTD